MKVPNGEHTVRFEFKPKSFANGELVSYLCSGLILLGFLWTSGTGMKNWYETLPEEEITSVPKKVAAKQPIKKTVSKKKKKK